jgi:hypothetical protein
MKAHHTLRVAFRLAILVGLLLVTGNRLSAQTLTEWQCDPLSCSSGDYVPPWGTGSITLAVTGTCSNELPVGVHSSAMCEDSLYGAVLAVAGERGSTEMENDYFQCYEVDYIKSISVVESVAVGEYSGYALEFCNGDGDYYSDDSGPC